MNFLSHVQRDNSMLWLGDPCRPDGTLSCFHAQCAAAPKTKFRLLKKLKLTKGGEPPSYRRTPEVGKVAVLTVC